MSVERYLRLIAGMVVLIGSALAFYHSPYWFLLVFFVSFNLIQSAFTNWCPMMTLLRLLGAKDEGRLYSERT